MKKIIGNFYKYLFLLGISFVTLNTTSYSSAVPEPEKVAAQKLPSASKSKDPFKDPDYLISEVSKLPRCLQRDVQNLIGEDEIENARESSWFPILWQRLYSMGVTVFKFSWFCAAAVASRVVLIWFGVAPPSQLKTSFAKTFVPESSFPTNIKEWSTWLTIQLGLHEVWKIGVFLAPKIGFLVVLIVTVLSIIGGTLSSSESSGGGGKVTPTFDLNPLFDLFEGIVDLSDLSGIYSNATDDKMNIFNYLAPLFIFIGAAYFTFSIISDLLDFWDVYSTKHYVFVVKDKFTGETSVITMSCNSSLTKDRANWVVKKAKCSGGETNVYTSQNWGEYIAGAFSLNTEKYCTLSMNSLNVNDEDITTYSVEGLVKIA